MSKTGQAQNGPVARRSLGLILHLSSRNGKPTTTKGGSGGQSQSPPCSPSSPVHPYSTSASPPSLYSSPNSSFGGYSTTSLRSPLLSPSVQMNAYEPQQGEPVPPTHNDLDAREKTMLMKKARKLSQVFGDVRGVVHSVAPGAGAGASAQHKPTHQHQQHQHRRSASTSTSTSSGSSSSSSAARRHPDTDVPCLPQISEARLSFMESFANASESSLPLHEEEESSSSVQASVPLSARPSITLARAGSTPNVDSLDENGDGAGPRRLMYTRRSSIDVIPQSLQSSTDRPSGVKRSRSMAMRKKPSTRHEASQESVDFRTRYNDNFGADAAMSLRQKALNVQRARKMAKVFGQDPPSSLIHISDDSRTSLHRVSGEDIDSLPSTPTAQTFSKSSPSSHAQVSTDDSTGPTFTSDFRDRRRRAEKLSRFFGVAYQNIEFVAPPTRIKPVLERAPSSKLERTASNVQVDVKVSRSRFWGFDSGEKTREADMVDVIDKLRGLKAT